MSWGLKDEKEVITLAHTGIKAWQVSCPGHLIDPFSRLSISPGTMGCSCSSNPEDDWMENIDVCENCHYPIVPLDGKATVRGKTRGLVRESGGGHNPEGINGAPLQVLEITEWPSFLEYRKEKRL